MKKGERSSDLFFLHNFWLCCFFLLDGVESSGLPTAASPEIFISAAQEAHDAYKRYHYDNDNDRDDPAMRVP